MDSTELDSLDRIELGHRINTAESKIMARAYHTGRDGFEPVIVHGDRRTNWGAFINGDELSIPGGTLTPSTDSTNDCRLADVVKPTTIRRVVDKLVTRDGLTRDEARAGMLYDAFDSSAGEVADRVGINEDNVESVVTTANAKLSGEVSLKGSEQLVSTVSVDPADAR
ncbi:hypothetical protein [Natrinema versiforme]|uniref:Uncharacterized protein n=1 Tax=Natrinema versiforme TaxID=88724 RepID=A0A4P8WJI5_9EURY|nr:hypothetical protein [Natrinema versiforme]QCS43639.1 hypothetical protein FEJ81_15250 [Natrinema versiforme]